MKELLEKFEKKRPEIIFEWKDPESEAEGWVVINSLRGGAAGGGTRMRPGLDKHEVESLAKTMEVKFTVSGPPIGGAKSGINFDPNDPRKEKVLERWFEAVKPLLKQYYGTGGDLNVDEIKEVIPITEDVGIWHPQEGVFKGHFHPTEPQLVNRIGQLRLGVIKIIEDPTFTPSVARKYTIADMITGFGVSEAIKHYYAIWGGDIHKKRAVVQGWGNVGAAAGYFLTQMGAHVVGIIDKDGGIYKEEGFSLEEIRELFINRKGNKLNSDYLIPSDEFSKLIWEKPFEIFVPAAASRLLTRDHVQAMINGKVEVISCGANVPFADPEIFFGDIGVFADNNLSVIPDFIANCGMARVFAFLMEDEVEVEDRNIFDDVSNCIRRAMLRTYEKNTSTKRIAQTSFEIALRQLM